MQKNVAVTAALAVVLAVFFGGDILPAVGFAPITADASPSIGISIPRLSFPKFGFGTFSKTSYDPVASEAWEAFASYRSAAQEHNLAEVDRISYQLSSVCKAAITDISKAPDCNQLMDSVAFFTGGFRQENFSEVAFDDRQVVLATPYMKHDNGSEKWVISFVRTETGPKLLGINFCTGEDSATDVCAETDPAKRDTNNNGWWDSLEQFFRK